MFKLFLSIIYVFSCLLSIIRCETKNVLLLNVVDEDPTAAANSLIVFLQNLNAHKFPLEILIYISKQAHEKLNRANPTATAGFTVLHYTLPRYLDKTIDKKFPTIDHVTPIIEAWTHIASVQSKSSVPDDASRRVISLTITNSAMPSVNANFMEIYNLFTNKDLSTNHLLLLGKTTRLTSVSDWHDLLVAGFIISNPSVQEWINTLSSVFHYHADRPYFSMLEPRPSLLEANKQGKKDINLSVLTRRHICAEHTADAETAPSKFCTTYESKTFLKINCGISVPQKNTHCPIISLPHSWKSKLGLHDTGMSYASRIRVEENKWFSDLPKIEFSTNRLFLGEGDVPAPFCWATGSEVSEDGVKSSKIYTRNKDKVITSDYIPPVYPKSNWTYALYTAHNGNWRELDEDMYPNLGKMYYAKRHGYKFNQVLSPQFMGYMENLLTSLDNYGRGVSIKTAMIVDGIYRTDADWLLWMDSDTAFNSEWVHMPLDAYTAGVPEDKVWISTNYKALLTGVFLVRNNIQGRKLLRDWLSIIMSGQVTCHGFDQASIEVLMMQRLNGSFAFERPYDLSCKHARHGGAGCNAEGDYSCDYKFEKALIKLGFRTNGRANSQPFWGGISSFSRGCANDYVKEFHVSYETPQRPRLHCFFCGGNDRIDAQFWDGPLGGSNDRVRDGAVNSWFTNHKMQWLFAETWIQPNACKKLDFIPKCNPNAHTLNFGRDKKQQGSKQWLIGLVDGIAFDGKQNQYCELSDELKKQQKAITYMRDYKEAIAAAKRYPPEAWYEAYWKSAGAGRADFCKVSTVSNPGCSPHGLQWLRPQGLLLPKNYCESCKIVKMNPDYDVTGQRRVVECLLSDEHVR